MNGAPHDRRGLHFDLGVALPDQETGIIVAAAGDPLNARTPQIAQKVLADVIKDRVNVFQRRFTVFDRQIGQIDIDREPRHVAIEEVDRRSTLQCEGLVAGDEWKVRTRWSTWRMYWSRAIRALLWHQVIRDCDAVDGVQPAARRQRPVTLAEIDGGDVDVPAPCMIVLVSKREEKTLGFDASA